VSSLMAVTPEPRTPLPQKHRSVISVLWGVLASALVSLTSVWLYFSDLRFGKLGLIDDHEYLSYLGSDRMIAWSEIPAILSQTEAGSWGESPRFRPGYYLLRILQTKFFLGDGQLWYSSRLVLFAFSLFLLGITLWVLVGRVLQVARLSSGVVTLLQFGVMTWAIMAFISVGSWGDIVTRLGPSESFVFLGLSLMSFGLMVIHSGPRSWIGNVIANFGFILAVTNKENGIFLIVPLVIFVLIQLRKDDFTKLYLAPLFISTLMGVWVVSGVFLAITKSETDIYGDQRTISGGLAALGSDPRTILISTLLVIVIALELGINQSLNIKAEVKDRSVLSLMRRYPMSLVALSVTCIFYAEHYFYQNSLGGDVFQPARYGMLTELAMAVMSLTAVLLALRSIGVLKRGILAMGLMVVSTLLSFWLMSSSLGTISHAAANYPTASKGAVAQKAQQMVIIETMSQSLEAAPDMQVLIFADEPYDFERVYSLPLFLDFYSGREVAFYLETRIPDELKPDELSQGLSDWLDGISLNGGWKISPIREFDSDKPTMCVYFGQLVESDYCDTTLGLD